MWDTTSSIAAFWSREVRAPKSVQARPEVMVSRWATGRAPFSPVSRST
jgi:hypothetical protein